MSANFDGVTLSGFGDAGLLPEMKHRFFRSTAEQPGAGGDPTRLLEGHIVLVVEDDVFVGLELAQTLEDLGAEVIGPIRTLERAETAAAAGGFDVALLDVNLDGRYSFGVAEALVARKVPVLFVTAHASDEHLFPSSARDIPRLPKPVQRRGLISALHKLL